MNCKHLTISAALVLMLTGAVGAADDERNGGIPLRKLAGTFSETIQASLFVCFSTTPPFPLAKCGSAGSTDTPLNALAVGAQTRDAAGNQCTTWTEADSDSPLTASPPTVYVLHQTGTTTSYDPTTGTGEGSFTNYFGGKCNGTAFDSTGATVANTGTFHFGVSNHGNRMDAMVTSLIPPVSGAFGGFSIPATLLRQ
jgi:hypothetical protein